MATRVAFQRVLPLACLVVINLINALYDILVSQALAKSSVHPFVFSLLRDAGAALLLFTANAWRQRRAPKDEVEHLTPLSDLGVFFLQGLLSIYGSQGLTSMALLLTGGTYVSMFAPITPAATLAISLLLGLEGFHPLRVTSWAKVFGIFVSVTGALMVAVIAFTGGANSISSSTTNLAVGTACIVTAKTLCAPLGAILQKHLLQRYKAGLVASNMYLLGTVCLLTAVMPLTTTPSFWALSDRDVWLALGYSIVVVSGVNSMLVLFVNKRLNPVLLTSSYPLETLFTALLAWQMQGTTLSPLECVGAGVITLGLVTLVWSKYLEGFSPHYPVPLNDGDGDEEEEDVEQEELDMTGEEDGAAQEAAVEVVDMTHLTDIDGGEKGGAARAVAAAAGKQIGSAGDDGGSAARVVRLSATLPGEHTAENDQRGQRTPTAMSQNHHQQQPWQPSQLGKQATMAEPFGEHARDETLYASLATPARNVSPTRASTAVDVTRQSDSKQTGRSAGHIAFHSNVGVGHTAMHPDQRFQRGADGSELDASPTTALLSGLPRSSNAQMMSVSADHVRVSGTGADREPAARRPVRSDSSFPTTTAATADTAAAAGAGAEGGVPTASWTSRSHLLPKPQKDRPSQQAPQPPSLSASYKRPSPTFSAAGQGSQRFPAAHQRPTRRQLHKRKSSLFLDADDAQPNSDAVSHIGFELPIEPMPVAHVAQVSTAVGRSLMRLSWGGQSPPPAWARSSKRLRAASAVTSAMAEAAAALGPPGPPTGAPSEPGELGSLGVASPSAHAAGSATDAACAAIELGPMFLQPVAAATLRLRSVGVQVGTHSGHARSQQQRHQHRGSGALSPPLWATVIDRGASGGTGRSRRLQPLFEVADDSNHLDTGDGDGRGFGRLSERE